MYGSKLDTNVGCIFNDVSGSGKTLFVANGLANPNIFEGALFVKSIVSLSFLILEPFLNLEEDLSFPLFLPLLAHQCCLSFPLSLQLVLTRSCECFCHRSHDSLWRAHRTVIDTLPPDDVCQVRGNFFF